MIRDARLTAFLATSNPGRARVFYEETLGLRLLTDDEYAIAFDCGGNELRVQKVERFEPHAFTALGWRVPDIRAAIAGLLRAGVRFERYSFLEQDDLGIWLAPSGTRVAWFKDPDGNLLALSQAGAA